LELIADRGVLRKVPAQEWNRELAELHLIGHTPEPKAFTNAIKEFGSLLTSHVPATGENPNELPDLPRVELK
jgi:uncharacterized membrane protein